MDISRPTIDKPVYIPVERFIESRSNSIAQLLKAIDNDALVSGEVTKGPRTAAQRLPRHMRRRAMAYKVRRFPRGMREFAATHLITKHRKKPPSRFSKRKPSNILKRHMRRDMKNGKWMETHIWHAKRFRMVTRWGYKLPERSYQRGYRTIIRDSYRHCSIRDHSYFICIKISSEEIQNITCKLKNLLDSYSFSKICSKWAREAQNEFDICLYDVKLYPHGFIGPGRFQWIDNNMLSLWIHPAAKDNFLTCLSAEFGLGEISDQSIYENNGVKVEVMDGCVNRFRIIGPLALRTLSEAIKLSNDERFNKHHQKWNQLMSLRDPMMILADGLVLTLSIEDPKICWSRKIKKESKELLCGEGDFDVEPINTLFWNCNSQDLINSRLSTKEFEKKNADKINGIERTNCKIPLVVIARNRNDRTLDGVDVCVPESFGKDLWVSLQRRGARSSGLRDEASGHLESLQFLYPNDDPESKGGLDFQKCETTELLRRYHGKPHNRRCKYWSDLSIKNPFDFGWNELINDWKLNESSIACPYVAREYLLLKRLEKTLKEKIKIEENLDGCLAPVIIEFIGRGRPKRLAIVCIPTNEDLRLLKRNHKMEITQKTRNEDEDEDLGEEEEEEEDEKVVRKKTFVDEFVSLDFSANEEKINLKELFACSGTLDEKSIRRTRVNRKKKEAARRRKAEKSKRDEFLVKEDIEKSVHNSHDSANREIIGRLVSGEQSLLRGHGCGLGYIAANCLDKIAQNYGTKSLVMVRNPTSKYYHPAVVEIQKKVVNI